MIQYDYYKTKFYFIVYCTFLLNKYNITGGVIVGVGSGVSAIVFRGTYYFQVRSSDGPHVRQVIVPSEFGKRFVYAVILVDVQKVFQQHPVLCVTVALQNDVYLFIIIVIIDVMLYINCVIILFYNF